MVKRKKGGLGEDPLAWIQKTEVSEAQEAPEPGISNSSEVRKLETSEDEKLAISELDKPKTEQLPKFMTFEVRLSILIREDQLEYLEKTVRSIMKKRRGGSGAKERVTKNTVIRAMIDALRKVPFDTAGVPDEEALRVRIEEAIRGRAAPGLELR